MIWKPRRNTAACVAPPLATGMGLTAQAVPATAAGRTTAPGAPGTVTGWLPADKSGFGTSHSTDSKVWFTLQDGRLSEMYHPSLDTRSMRELGFVITDGHSFAVRAEESSRQVTRLSDRKSLTYQVVTTDDDNRWRLTTTYATDPARSTMLVDADFDSLTGKPYQDHTVYDPALSSNSADGSGRTQGGAPVASDAGTASTLVASTGFTATSSGYRDTSDGWTDLLQDKRMDWQYSAAPEGNVVQTGRTALTGLGKHRSTTLGLGFGAAASEALDTANASLDAGFAPGPAPPPRRRWPGRTPSTSGSRPASPTGR